MSERLPVPGLPGQLPEAEHLLWQGSPSWKALAVRTFHGRTMSIYFAFLLVWVAVASFTDGGSAAGAARSVLFFAPFAATGIGLVLLLAWLTARTTIYTITDRRVVFSYGIAMPMSLNLPFARIASASVKTFADGAADIPLAMVEGDKVAYLVLWPHARPWRITKPEPAMRAIADGAKVADILARALAAAAEQPVQPVAVQPSPAGISVTTVPTAAAA